MNEKLARWRSVANNRLRLELFEERWTLGGSGFLDAPLGFVGMAALIWGTNETSELSAAAEKSASPSENNDAGSGSSPTITERLFVGTEQLISETSSAETPSSIATNVVPVLAITDSLGTSLDDRIVGSTDAFDILDNIPSSTSPDNLVGTDVNGPGSMRVADAGGSVQGVAFSRNAGGTAAASVRDEGVSNYAGGNDSLNEAISRGSSSIAEGAFARSAGHLVNSHGGFRTIPMTRGMIAEGIADPNVPRITNLNRNAATMMGGWNPALRSIMVMDDGSRWFAAEQGTDVNVNSKMIYYRLGEDGWKAAGSVVLPPGIQQNMSTITDGRLIYSYGITRSSVIETWFNPDKPGWNLNTGNALLAGDSMIHPGSDSNYVGAAWHNDTRIVWWTSVGANGSGGRWSYSYNQGTDWRSPVVSSLGGFNDVGYVHAQFDDQSRLRMIGESYRGQYPFGEKYLFSTTLTLGKAASWAPVLQQTAYTPLDIWQEGSGSAQYLYRTRTDRIGYGFGFGSAAHSTTFAALGGRFIADESRLGLVLSYGNFMEVRVIERSEATGFIDWNVIEPVRIGFPKSLGTAGLSAIWNVDHSKQPIESNQLEFAICGAYPAFDHLVYHYTIK